MTPEITHKARGDVYDSSLYASSGFQKLKRSLELSGKYYLIDVPRYFRQRRQLQLPGVDFAVVGNPLREFHLQAYHELPLPPAFEAALALSYDAGVRFSLPPVRLEAVAAAWWASHDSPGDAIECGAYRGATSLLLATLGRLHNIQQRIMVLDTFQGMPATSRFDGRRPTGEFAPPEDQVRIIQAQATKLQVDDRLEVCQGLFADTFASWSDRKPQFSFVHIDANIYQGTLDACHYCIPRTAPGGRIVFDDYNGLNDLGARLAIDQALIRSGVRPVPLAHCSAIIHFPRGD